MSHICLSIHPSTGCFHPLTTASTTVNHAAMNMGEQLSLWDSALNSLGYILRSETAGSHGDFVKDFFSNCHFVFHGNCALLHSHQHCTRAPTLPHPCQHFLEQPPQWVWGSTGWGLDFHFPSISEIAPFHVFIGHLHIFFGEISIQVLCSLLIEFICVCLAALTFKLPGISLFLLQKETAAPAAGPWSSPRGTHLDVHHAGQCTPTQCTAPGAAPSQTAHERGSPGDCAVHSGHAICTQWPCLLRSWPKPSIPVLSSRGLTTTRHSLDVPPMLTSLPMYAPSSFFYLFLQRKFKFVD